MASANLPVNVDSTYADSTLDPGVKAHQQHHDKIHAHVNLFDKDLPRADGDVLAWDVAQQLWVPTDISGTTGGGAVQTTYSTAAPGTLFRLTWNGVSWPGTRPSGRTDIFFNLKGAPEGTANPTWFLTGDDQLYAGLPLTTAQVTTIAQNNGGSGGGLPAGTTLEDIPNGATRLAMVQAERDKLATVAQNATNTPLVAAGGINGTATTAMRSDRTFTPTQIGAVAAVDGIIRQWKPRPAAQGYPTVAEGAQEGDIAELYT